MINCVFPRTLMHWRVLRKRVVLVSFVLTAHSKIFNSVRVYGGNSQVMATTNSTVASNLRFVLEMLGFSDWSGYIKTYFYRIVIAYFCCSFRTKLCTDPVPNVYVSPSLLDITTWNGVIFPQSGYFQGGIFRFTIRFDGDRPTKIPKITFETAIYHPLVDPRTLELNVLPQFEPNGQHHKESNPKPRVMDLLRYIKDALVSDVKYWHNAMLIFNKQCFQSYLDYVSQDPSTANQHPFIQRIQQCVRSSVAQKDLDLDLETNPILLDCTETQQKHHGHSQIIRENLKTFKVANVLFCSLCCRVSADDWFDHLNA